MVIKWPSEEEQMRIRSCFLILLFGAARCLLADVLYSVTELGSLGGGLSHGLGINQAGEVTGGSVTLSAYANDHAFLYSNGQMTDLGTLDGGRLGTDSQGSGINNRGQVAGYSSIPGGSHAFLYSNGQMKDLGTLGGQSSLASDINDAGQVTGVANTSAGASHAFLYSNDQMMDLGTLGGSYSGASAINNAEQITGTSYTSTGPAHAFLYSNGQMIDLGTLGQSYISSSGADINNSGQVTGDSSMSNGASRAFLYSNGQMIDLGTLGNSIFGNDSYGGAINDAGQVVGSYGTGSFFHPFLYSNGQMVDLNNLIDPALGITLTGATDINNYGQIVANGEEGTSPGVHAFLLTPVPEPHTGALLGISLLALLVWSPRMRHWHTELSDPLTIYKPLS
jgi:probable HAF family extracellular repeat protein